MGSAHGAAKRDNQHLQQFDSLLWSFSLRMCFPCLPVTSSCLSSLLAWLMFPEGYTHSQEYRVLESVSPTRWHWMHTTEPYWCNYHLSTVYFDAPTLCFLQMCIFHISVIQIFSTRFWSHDWGHRGLEMLCWALRWTIHSKMNKLQQFCKEKWANGPTQWCERFVAIRMAGW